MKAQSLTKEFRQAGISFDDGFQESARKPGFKKTIPAWALDDSKLRIVIEEMGRRYRRSARTNQPQMAKHRQAARRAGNHRAYLAGILYRSWRLDWDSATIAAEMAITAHVVRNVLTNARYIGGLLEANRWKPLPSCYAGEHLRESSRQRLTAMWADPVYQERMRWRRTPYSGTR
jgi:hypothetical protein